MKQFTYLFIDLACILIPFIASFHKKILFYKEWKYFFPANILVAFGFLLWDYWFTENGIWGFNSDYLTGVYLYNLPLEELLFFICIPYACVFTYFVLKKYLTPKYYQFLGDFPLFFLLIISFLGVVLNLEKKYTLFTALLLFITLCWVRFKKINVNLVFISYLSILPFFFLSNGILTGSFLAEPIVWYNNNENLGIRMFTIPVEDIFYGFLLILLIILIYEYFKEKVFLALSYKSN